MNPGWLKIGTAAKYCDVSRRTVRNWLAEDGLPHSRVRGTILISRPALDRWLEDHAAQGGIDPVVDGILMELNESAK